MTVILTGFEPFANYDTNPSAQLIEWFRPQAQELDITCMTLPVSAQEIPRLVGEMLARKPQAVIALGLGSGAAIRIERVAVNLADFRIPDASQDQPVDQSITAQGPNAYFSTLPVREITDQLLAQGIPATLSNTAGTYLCNMLLYSLLHATHGSRVPVGFVHLPQTPEMVARQLQRKPTDAIAPSMSLELMQQAVATILQVTKRFLEKPTE